MPSVSRSSASARRLARSRVSLGAVLVALAVPSSAHAQSTSHAAAEALFDEGRGLVTSGRVAEGCAKLAQSQALDPAAGTLLNLADCYEKAGRTASSWLTYSEAVSASEKSGRAEWAKLARAKVAALRTGLPMLRIVFPSPAPEGLEVLRDGVPIAPAEADLAVPVDPGRHTIEARAPGKVPFSTTLQTAPKETSEVRIPELQTDKAHPAPKRNEPSAVTLEAAPVGHQRTWGYVAGGIGLAALAAGGIAGALAIGSKSEAVDQCSSDLSVCTSEGADAMGRARGQALVSTIAVAAGAALLATGGVLILTAPRSPGPARAAGAAPAALGLYASPFGARLVAHW